MMDANAIWMVLMLVVPTSAFLGFLGWASHNEVKIRRWYRKRLGVASEELIERVLEVVDYTLRRGSGDEPDRVEFAAWWRDIQTEGTFERDFIRISIHANGDSDLRPFLDTAFEGVRERCRGTRSQAV